MYIITILRAIVGPFIRRNITGFRLLSLLILLSIASGALVSEAKPAQAESILFPAITPFGSTQSTIAEIAVGDLDNDGDLDVVTIGSKQNVIARIILIYKNDGQGHFIEGQSWMIKHDFRYTLAVADLNKDGSLDILFENFIYLNDGTGDFEDGYIFDPSSPYADSLAVGDLDGDSDVDIVIGRHGLQNIVYNTVYLNDGSAHFPVSFNLISGPSKTRRIAMGDLDGDGDLDIVVGNSGIPNLIYFNDGAGNFPIVRPFGPGNDNTSDIAIADMDGDDSLDIIVVNAYNVELNQPEQSFVYLNDGQGYFYTGDGTCSTPGLRCVGTTETRISVSAVGDVDSDGDIDIVLGGDNASLYLNDGPAGFSRQTLPTSVRTIIALAIADMDGNGQLDLIISNSGNNVLFFNHGTDKLLETQPYGNEAEHIFNVTVGDVNGDGHLDLINNTGKIYLNDGHGHFDRGATPCGSSPAVRCIGSAAESLLRVVPADLDADEDLDLVAITSMNRKILPYFNDGSGNFLTGNPFTTSNSTYDLVTGDLNNDGHLDLVTSGNGPAIAYFNDGTGTFSKSRIISTTNLSVVFGLIIGDFDNDGDLDVVMSQDFSPIAIIYFNDGAGNFPTNGPINDFGSVLVQGTAGDFDNDGDLDLATYLGSNLLIRFNDGDGRFPTREIRNGPASYTNYLATGDIDGNGSLDIVAGTGRLNRNSSCCPERSLVYFNDGRGHFPITNSFGDPTATTQVALGDLNTDGALDIVTRAKTGTSAVHLNTTTHGKRIMNGAPYVSIVRPGSTQNANFYSVKEVLTNTTIPITYTVFDQESDPVNVRVFYSLNGGGQWQPAVAETGTMTRALATSPTGTTHTFRWNTFKSNLFGTSHNVVVRIEAYPDLRPGRNRAVGPYQRPYLAAQTFPFRVRGTQIRVMKDTTPAHGAVVYRLPLGSTSGGKAIGSPGGAPLLTDQEGYLQGYGEIAVGDRLLALAPITSTERYTLYHSNGTPNNTGISTDSVAQPGLQTLVVSREHPLLLFNLDVSLEWDAHNDPGFLGKVQNDLKQTSRHLYDMTDGQVALGKVTLRQNADNWANADVVVHATNDFRPFAAQGGIVVTPTIDLEHDDTIYDTGQVHIGATWNRYGNPGESLGQDWSLILAHELSHYLLFQDDTYLGLTETGLLKIVDSCHGSAMGDVYKPDNTEFVFNRDDWNYNCDDTLANTTLQRSEWETLKLWYPDLIIPTITTALTGPTVMPFSLTDVEVLDPITPTLTLDDPTMTLHYDNGAVSSAEARAFLMRENKYIIDLGSPYGEQNRVLARGAVVGDRLCVFDRFSSQLGCKTLSASDTQITVKERKDWTPFIRITDVTSTTYTIEVTSIEPGLMLKARLFPEFGEGMPPVALSEHGGVYKGTFDGISMLALHGHIQVWVDEIPTDGQPRRETIMAYSVGGNPGWVRPGGGWSRAGGGWVRPGGGWVRPGGGWVRPGGAPIVSSNGKMTYFPSNPVNLKPGDLFTIQSMAGLPPLPAGKVLVGQGYNLVASAQASLPAGSINVQYLEQDMSVTKVDESTLYIHYWNGSQWQVLPTTHDSYYNFTSAPSHGPGIYALLEGSTTPTLTSFLPREATSDITTTLTIMGQDFLAPLTIELVDLSKPLSIPLSLQSFSTTSVTATVPPGLTPGAYHLRVTNGDGDEKLSVDRFALHPPEATQSCFTDWFGSGAGRWETNGDWQIVTLPDGEKAMTDSPLSPYLSAAPGTTLTTSITSADFDLKQCVDPILTFRHDYMLANVGTSADRGSVELSLDQGTTWHTLASYSGGHFYGATEHPQDVPSTEWSNIDWTEVRIDLSQYSGIARLRFTLTVDDQVADRGWIIDDVGVKSREEKYRIFIPSAHP